MQNPRIKKAEKFLHHAKVLYKNECFDSCISRCYYCLFHAALALLEKFNVPSEARKHRYIFSAFPREFVHRRKFFSSETGRFLENLYKMRCAADYEYEEFSEKRAKRLLDKTESIYHSMVKVYGHERQQEKRT